MFHRSHAFLSILLFIPLTAVTVGCATERHSESMPASHQQALNSTKTKAPLTDREKQERFEELFEALDTNHDGVLSRAELQAGIRRLGRTSRPESTDMVYSFRENGTKSKPPNRFEKFKSLTPEEQDRLVATAFARKNTKTAAADQEHLSKEEFRKIVIGPENEMSTKDETDSNFNSWKDLL